MQIPEKSLFKLNEVAALTEVRPYVLRFWESEFEGIDPILSSSGQKLYEHKDIEVILRIKKFLFEDKMNIEQAKAELDLETDSDQPPVDKLVHARDGLKKILERTTSLKQSLV